MSLKLYSVPVSLYCAKIRIVLRHKGLAFEVLAPPGGEGAGSYKTIVPSGNLPALFDGDFLLADSEAIAEYLEEAYPAVSMLPGDAKARGIQREFARFHDTRLEPALRKLFPIVKTGAGDGARVTAEISTRLGQLSQMLKRRNAGAPLSLGDCGFGVTFPWIDALCGALGHSVDWPDAVRAYRAELEVYPAVRDELADYVGVMAPWIAQFRKDPT